MSFEEPGNQYKSDPYFKPIASGFEGSNKHNNCLIDYMIDNYLDAESFLRKEIGSFMGIAWKISLEDA